MPATETSAGYSPAAPITATVNSVLTQDAVSTNTIPVDTNSPNPVAAFRNHHTKKIESLGLVTPDGATGLQLSHIARSGKSQSGWVVNAIGGGITAAEVAAATPFNGEGGTYGFYIDANGISYVQLEQDGVTWSDPVQAWAGAATNIGVAYASTGAAVIYANTGGDLVVVTQSSLGGAFTGSVTSMNKTLSPQFVLTMEGATNWWVSANDGGALVIYSGQLGATTFTGMNSNTGFNTLQQVVLGMQVENTLLCFGIDSTNVLHVWSSASPGSSGGTLQQVPNSEVVTAAAHIGTGGTINLYSIDQSQNLWVLHQDPNTPWIDGAPNFVPYLPLDSEILMVASDMNPADAPTLFAIDSSLGSLRLHAQDPKSKMWSSGTLLQASAEVYDITRYHTEISFVDANGAPVPHYPVSLQVAEGYSATDIAIATSTYSVSSAAAIDLKTDALGKVTMAMLPVNGLAAPMFNVTADNLTPLASFSPAQPVHTYLSGSGILNPTQPTQYGGPLPVFDAAGNTLATAQVYQQGTLAPGAANNPQLASSAASAIINTALSGSQPNVYAYAGNFREGTFRTFATQEELLAALGAPAEPDSFWSSIAHFFGDIWEGIKNGVMKIVNFVVTVADKVANFVLQIGNAIEQAVKVVIKGIEEAGQFIAGVFQAVEAEIDKVVDWLKALFDFGAIWRTKMAFESMLLSVPPYISSTAAAAGTAANDWFKKQEATIKNYFDQWLTQYAPPGQTFSQQQGWQTPGQPSTTPVAGGAAPSDFTSNPHHNWLQNKVQSNAPKHLGISASAPSQDPWTNFDDAMSGAKHDFVAALKDFLDGITNLVGSQPNGIGASPMYDFISGIEKLVQTALKLADALVNLIAGMAEGGMSALLSVLNTELDLGFVNKLWAWLASAAGYPDDSALTVSALVSLVAAFPTTLIYKLIMGVDTEPFPSGSSSSFAGFSAMPAAAVLCGAILDVLYVIPQLVADALGSDTPQWMTIGMVGLTLTIWILENGLPDWSTLEWATFGAVAGNLLWILPLTVVIVKTSYPDFYKNYATTDTMAAFMTLVGIGQELFGMVSIIENPPDSTAVAISDVFSPFSNMFSFLGMKEFSENPWATGGKMVIDFISYVVGGVSQVVAAEG